MRDKNSEPVAWLEINTDITSRKRAEEAAHSLSGRILTLQDQERRKMARRLHDSLGQYVASLKMNIDLLLTTDGNRQKLASECSEIVEKCLSETRTISHLLHPPMLDEAGFGSAARGSLTASLSAAASRSTSICQQSWIGCTKMLRSPCSVLYRRG